MEPEARILVYFAVLFGVPLLFLAVLGARAARRKVATRVEHVPNTRDEIVVSIEYEPTRVARWLGAEPHTERYRGSCTVWHHYPDGTRANVCMEQRLSAVWQAWQWKQQDAHQT